MDIDAKHMQAIEGGSGNVTVRTLVALAVAFGVDPRDLLAPAPVAKPRPRGRPPRKTIE
jgi:transcriptional regulator with XRE-family HTH domain